MLAISYFADSVYCFRSLLYWSKLKKSRTELQLAYWRWIIDPLQAQSPSFTFSESRLCSAPVRTAHCALGELEAGNHGLSKGTSKWWSQSWERQKLFLVWSRGLRRFAFSLGGTGISYSRLNPTPLDCWGLLVYTKHRAIKGSLFLSL